MERGGLHEKKSIIVGFMIGVYTPEGEQTQRCGLKPDVECWQTIEGISEGKDELLEQAAKLILE